MGLSALLSSIGGSTAGFADLALVLGSSRKAEDEAVALLRAANISPVPTRGALSGYRYSRRKTGTVARRMAGVENGGQVINRQRRCQTLIPRLLRYS